MNEINKELLKAQEEWERECYSKVLEGNENVISCAFSFGVSDLYAQRPKKIMIVGQEARSHTTDYGKWPLEKFQAWNIEVLESILHLNELYKKYRRYPFFQFINKIKSESGGENDGYFPCWNNIEKVTEYDENGKEHRITDRSQREILNGPISDGKTLLQREIEIARPNRVVFTIGPDDPYYFDFVLNFGEPSETPSVRNPIIDVTKNVAKATGSDIRACWTYHPGFLRRNGLFDCVIERIISDDF